MPLPPWSIEFLRRSLDEVATRSGKPESIEKIKQQATEILQNLPQSAARGIDAVLRSAETSKQSVERWSRKQTELCRPLINASGVLFDSRGSGIQISPEINEVGQDVLVGDHGHGEAFSKRLQDRLQKSIHHLDIEGDFRVAIATNLDAAVASLVALQCDSSGNQQSSEPGRSLVIHRSDAVRLPSGRSLPDSLNALARSLSSANDIKEVGSSNQRDANDFHPIRRACIVSADVGQQDGGPFCDLPSDAIQVCVAPYNPLTKHAWMESATPSDAGVARDAGVTRDAGSASDDGSKQVDSIESTKVLPESAEQLLQNGVDLVVLSGAGCLGGPEAGILIGKRELIEQIERSPAWPALRACDAIVAMSCLALQQVASGSHDEVVGSASMSPSDLVRVGLPNLQLRAERLATRLSGCDALESVLVKDSVADLAEGGRWHVPSRQVCIKHRERSPEEWLAALADDFPEVLATVHDGRLTFDLRWVSPAQEVLLAEALER